MTYKIKNEEEIKAIAYKDQEGDFWISEQEEKDWQNDEYHSLSNFYSVIPRKSPYFDACISNETSSRYYVNEEVADIDFKKIFGWVSEYEITKETHPEYFI